MTKTVNYSQELYGKVMERMADYHQTGETVCGAQDPAVISLSEPVAGYEGYTVVRVTERYVSPWQSDTFLVFSDDAITPEEYKRYEEVMEGYGY